MKRLMITAALLGGCASEPRSEGRAPDFDLPSLDGGRVRGSSLWADRPVLLVFMTAW